MKRNLTVNAFLNVIKTSLSIIFPLITYPYVSRILGVENLGKVNYVSSLVGYFSQVAALGISTYAIREGGRIRENKEELSKLGNEMFTINIVSTLLAYLLLLLTTLLFIDNLEYRILIAIQSLTIISTTLGVDWVNILFEDYLYITIRSIFIQIISLLMMFMLVKTPNDIYIYAIITVISSALSCILNLFYSHRYLHLRLTRYPFFKKHYKPIIILFFSSLAINIYANSDTLILEWLKGSYYVGLYAVAVKIYTVLKSLLASIYSVTIPKLSHFYAHKNVIEFKKTYTRILSYVTLVLLPMSAGLIVLSKEIILFMGGQEYIEAQFTLQLLAISLIGAIFGGVLTYALNIPIGKEKINFKGSIYAIFINVGLSFVLIPKLNQNGGAISTIASEFFIVFYNFLFVKESKEFIDIKFWYKNFRDALIGFFTILFWGDIVNSWINNTLLSLIVIAISSILVYVAELALLKNKVLEEVLLIFEKKIKELSN